MTTLTATPNPDGTVSLTYAVGRVPADAVTYAWTGSDGRTTSTRTGPNVTTRTNLALDPEASQQDGVAWSAGRIFGTGGAGTYVSPAVRSASDGPSITPTTGPGGAHKLTSYRRKTWTTGTATAAANADSGHTYDNGTARLPVVPGAVYTVSAYMRAISTGSKALYARIAFYDAALNLTFANGPITTSVGGIWTRRTVTATAPATAATMSIILDVAGTAGTPWAAGDHLDVTALLIERVSTLGDYFSGNTPDVAPIPITSLTRTDTNGTRAVRTSAASLTLGGSVIDAELPGDGGSVTYTAAATDNTVTRTVTVAPLAARAQLVAGTARVTPYLVTGLDATRTPTTTAHDVIGRADPVVVPGPARLRRGRLEVLCRTWADAAAVLSLYAPGAPVFLRQREAPGLDLWHANVGDLSARSTGAGRWTVTVGYAEVGA